MKTESLICPFSKTRRGSVELMERVPMGEFIMVSRNRHLPQRNRR